MKNPFEENWTDCKRRNRETDKSRFVGSVRTAAFGSGAIPHDAGLVADLRTPLPKTERSHPEIPVLGPQSRRLGFALPGWLLAVKANKVLMLGLCVFAGTGAIAVSVAVSLPALRPAAAAKRAPSLRADISPSTSFFLTARRRGESPSLGFIADAEENFIHFRRDAQYRDALNKEESGSDQKGSGSGTPAGSIGDNGGVTPGEPFDMDKALAEHERAEFEKKRSGFIRGLSNLSGFSGAGAGRAFGGSGGFGGRKLGLKKALSRTVGRKKPGAKLSDSAGIVGAARLRGVNVLRGRSSRAAGQLKLANDLSRDAARRSDERAQRTAAADAFGQQKTTASEGALALSTDSEPVVPLGGGAPDMTSSSGGGSAGDAPEGERIDPYNGLVEKSLSLARRGAALKADGRELRALGLALIAFGSLFGAPTLIIAGIILVVIGQMKIHEGIRKIRESRRLADMIRDDEPYAQKDQGRILHDNADAADRDATYEPPEPAAPENTASEDAEAESRAGYSLR